MKKFYFLFFVLCAILPCNAQNEGNIWYFGDHAGLDFSSGNPIPLINGQLNTNEGCAVLSTPLGDLLFYTDGITVWNKNHQIMNNGINLFGHESTTQSATIIQKPGSDTIFYIFTIDAQFGPKGFCYSEIDMSLNNGLGSVITKNNYIKSPICEKIGIVRHANNLDYWIVVHGIGTNFYSYLLTSSGISNTPVQSNVGFSIPFSNSAAQGYIRFSPNGKKLAMTGTSVQKAEIFDFNSSTGIISNKQIILNGGGNWDNYYGVEFSPDGNLLYITSVSDHRIEQFDLTAPNISSTRISLLGGEWGNNLGALQLGPDGKIYVTNYQKQNLGVINNPNNLGSNCNYQPHSIDLNGKTSFLGLPNIYITNTITLSYTEETLCSGESLHFLLDTTLPIINSIEWNFGDGGTSTEINPTHLYQTSGTYTVTVTINSPNGIFTRSKEITITSVNTIPIPTLTSPQDFCVQENATFNDVAITGQNIQWYDALIGGNLLPNTTPMQHLMNYYASQTINGCESLRASIQINIYTTPAPTGDGNQSFCSTQNATLNDVVVNGSAINWYATASSTTVLPLTTTLVNGTTYYATQTVINCESVDRLAVTISLINTLNATDYDKEICDDLNDGTETVLLTDYNASLIADVANCTFTYYNSLIGATNENSSEQITNLNYPLSLGLKTIYVRIISSNSCYQIVELKLTLLSKPIIPIKDIMPICEGSSITVSAGLGFDSYLWSTGETSSSIVITNPGNYTVTVTENHATINCSSTKNFTVVKSNIATISEIITSDWTVNENIVTILLTGNSVGNYDYSLDGIHYQDSNVFTGLASGEYTVFVRDKNGCGIQPEDFYLLMYPKFFTPNGDGFNDTWKIKFSTNEPGLKIRLFDRFGKFLKELDNTSGWNGTLNNQELPSTDYWFVVTRANGKEHRGHFALKR